MTAVYDLAEAERQHLAYLATLEEEPEGQEEMDLLEMQGRINDMLGGLDGVRLAGGTLRATKLC